MENGREASKIIAKAVESEERSEEKEQESGVQDASERGEAIRYNQPSVVEGGGAPGDG